MQFDMLTYRRIWHEKRILRTIYHAWYRVICRDLHASRAPTLEIGGGSGNFKEFYPAVVSSDVCFSPWLDLQMDAQTIAVKNHSVANIVMTDILHHLSDPLAFLEEAGRVLQKGGRVILLEPFPSSFSYGVYKFFHPEPMRPHARCLEAAMRPPIEINQAIAYRFFFKDHRTFAAHFNGVFRIVKRRRLSALLYPLSGGFEHRSLIPQALVPLFQIAEAVLQPLMRWCAFRCYVVLERE
jgi:SAM-dependent methyltransferase